MSACNCARCAAIAEGLTEHQADARMLAWEDQQVAKFGWYSHIVLPETTRDLANYHTHGLPQDLQIVLPIDPVKAQGLFHALADAEKQGDVYEDGAEVYGILGHGYRLKMVAAEEGGRPVMRVILPDADGNLEKNFMHKDYARQYDGL